LSPPASHFPHSFVVVVVVIIIIMWFYNPRKDLGRLTPEVS
jgi:hypothetical protein